MRHEPMPGTAPIPAAASRCCQWFYRREGRKCGPFSGEELQAVVWMGFIRPDDLVRPACGTEWTPARSIEWISWKQP